MLDSRLASRCGPPGKCMKPCDHGMPRHKQQGRPTPGGRYKKMLATPTPAIELTATNERGPCANHCANLMAMT